MLREADDLPANVNSVLTEFVNSTQNAFANDLRSIVLYGSAAEGKLRPASDVNVIVVLARFDQQSANKMQEPLRLAGAAIKLRAMFLLEEEVQPVTEAFAVKFADIQRRRRVLYGDDPFASLSVSREDAIFRLQQTLLNLILRLRESYISRGPREEQLVATIAGAAGPLRSCAATLLEWKTQPFSQAETPCNRFLLHCRKRKPETRNCSSSRKPEKSSVCLREWRHQRCFVLSNWPVSCGDAQRSSSEVLDVNPFDLRGPEFLIFYICLALVVIISIVLLRSLSESASAPRIDLSDPLLIAYLRGGHTEAMRVAAVSLIDRGLLTCMDTRLQTTPNARAESVRRPIEKALLQKFASSGDVSSMFADPKLKSTLHEYEKTLKRVRLLPDSAITQARTFILAGAILILGGVGLIKILVALSRGRTNVAFLVVLILVAIVIAAKLSFPRLTQSGKAMLEDVSNLYSGLRDRASLLKPGGATIEPMMLAAVFGVGALGGEGFSYTRTLFGPPPESRSSKNNSCSSSCGMSGASCSSSSCSGSSCGGGCGGGGCGGCGS